MERDWPVLDTFLKAFGIFSSSCFEDFLFELKIFKSYIFQILNTYCQNIPLNHLDIFCQDKTWAITAIASVVSHKPDHILSRVPKICWLWSGVSETNANIITGESRHMSWDGDRRAATILLLKELWNCTKSHLPIQIPSLPNSNLQKTDLQCENTPNLILPSPYNKSPRLQSTEIRSPMWD